MDISLKAYEYISHGITSFKELKGFLNVKSNFSIGVHSIQPKDTFKKCQNNMQKERKSLHNIHMYVIRVHILAIRPCEALKQKYEKDGRYLTILL